MKILRTILIVLGILLIVLNLLAYLAPITPKDKSTAGLIGWYIGKKFDADGWNRIAFVGKVNK